MHRRRRQGFLLIEAMLAALAIAVGLVGISGAIGASVRALTRLQQADRRLRLAAMALDQAAIEAQRLRVAAPHAGVFDPPDEDYRWALTVTPARATINGDGVAVSAATLTVSRIDDDRQATRLATVWPDDWMAE